MSLCQTTSIDLVLEYLASLLTQCCCDVAVTVQTRKFIWTAIAAEH